MMGACRGVLALGALVVGLSLSGIVSAADQGPEQVPDRTGDGRLYIGVLAHDVDGLWSGFSRESGSDLNLEWVLPAGPLASWGEWAGGHWAPAVGVSLNSGSGTNKVYALARWQRDFGSTWFVASGLGLVWHDGQRHFVSRDRKALGSSWLFHIPFEAGYHLSRDLSVSLYFDHMSNAYTQPENEGLDTLGLRLGWAF